MEKLLDGLRKIQNATSRKDISMILRDIGQSPSGLLSAEIAEEKKKKGLRLFLLLLICIAVTAVTYVAYIGGGYIAEYVGPIALFFGALDLTITVLLFLNALKGNLRIILVAFEILSLAYLGYAVSGYFGGGNIRTAAEKKVVAANEVLKEYYTQAQATADLVDFAAQNATNVALVEQKRDGKGVVFEKASFISSMKPSELLPLNDSLPTVPRFENLTEANKWLQEKRSHIGSLITKYNSSMDAMRNQAKGTYEGLQNAMALSLSDQQKNNLQLLAGYMKQIMDKSNPTSKLSDDILVPGDLKADGFQSVIGYVIDGVIVFFILMLAFQKSSDKKIDEIKSQEVKALIERITREAEIEYDSEQMASIPTTKQAEYLRTILNSQELTQYVKTKSSFSEYVSFLKAHPTIARNLGKSLWLITDITKELQKNPDFANAAVDAIQLTPVEWKIIKDIVPIEQFFVMDSDTRTKFLGLLRQVQAVTRLKNDELKSVMAKFMTHDNPSTGFMQVLEICVKKLGKANLLNALSVNFVDIASLNVADFICTNLDNEVQLKKIAHGWTDDLNETFGNILSNGISEEVHFNRFASTILKKGGIDGIKKLASVYETKKAELNDSSIGNKTLTLQPDFKAMEEALVKGDDDAFLAEIDNAVKIKPSK